MTDHLSGTGIEEIVKHDTPLGRILAIKQVKLQFSYMTHLAGSHDVVNSGRYIAFIKVTSLEDSHPPMGCCEALSGNCTLIHSPGPYLGGDDSEQMLQQKKSNEIWRHTLPLEEIDMPQICHVALEGSPPGAWPASSPSTCTCNRAQPSDRKRRGKGRELYWSRGCVAIRASDFCASRANR